jgi:hypothetical protein
MGCRNVRRRGLEEMENAGSKSEEQSMSHFDRLSCELRMVGVDIRSEEPRRCDSRIECPLTSRGTLGVERELHINGGTK